MVYFFLSSYLKLSAMMMMMMMMWLVLSPPSHLQLIAKGRIDECGVKRNSPKGRLALNTVIGFHRIIVIVVVIIVLFILHILHIAQRGEWTHVVRIKSGSRRRRPPHREFNSTFHFGNDIENTELNKRSFGYGFSVLFQKWHIR